MKRGCVLRLEDGVDGIESGWFVFLGRDGASFRVCRGGEDEDGSICRSDDEHDLHIDFAECFRSLDLQVDGPRGCARIDRSGCSKRITPSPPESRSDSLDKAWSRDYDFLLGGDGAF